MNYQKLYDNLVLNAKQRTIELERYVIVHKIHYNSVDYQVRYIKGKLKEQNICNCCEAHHIIPKSDGGLNKLQNYVFFTPKEHIVAHHLLYKAQPSKKHFLAWHYLTLTNRKHIEYRLTAEQYKKLTELNRQYMENKIVTEDTRKKLSIASSGERNAMFGKHWYTNGIINIACNDSDNIPEGFYKGRTNVVPGEKHKSTIGCSWYNNGTINKLFNESDNIPDEFVKGMLGKNKRSYYTNGLKNICLRENDIIPNGFYRGMTKKKKRSSRYTCYNDGVRNYYLLDGEIVPGNFIKGSCKHTNYNMKLYNNGTINKMFKSNQEIPEGFILGRLRKDENQN